MHQLYKYLLWANRTRWADRLTYKSKNQPVSLKRLASAVVPTLRRPIFILGAPRSGTTFLGNSIAALSEISYHHEPVSTKAAIQFIYQRQWSRHFARFYYRQVYGWLMRIHLDGHLRFAEKTPRNCFIVPFLYWAFPDALFIHIIRDGRDVTLSLSKKIWLSQEATGKGLADLSGYNYGSEPQFWVETERKEEFSTTSDVHRCIWAWRRYSEAALEGIKTVPARQALALRYESLVTDPLKEAERLLEFLQITHPEAMGCFKEALQQAHTKSVGKWRKGLSERQKQEIEAEAGSLLRHLGYLP